VTRRRLYLETMRDILPAVKQVFVFDPSQQTPLLPFLDLQRSDVPAAGAGEKETRP
jgi:hypothetical protein